MTSLPAAPATMTLAEVPPRGARSAAATVVGPVIVATDAIAGAEARPAADPKEVIAGLTRGQTGRSVLREAEQSAMGRGVARC